jgi:dTMP kinase
MKPLFIAIEGLDGSGGTTQSRLLKEWLEQNGHNVHLTREPSEGPVGKFIKSALLNNTQERVLGENIFPYLFAADRQDHLDNEIFPALKEGKFVITDRYYHSSLAYQGLTLGIPFVANLNSVFRQPDLTLILWLQPEVSFERIKIRGAPVERYETLDHLRSIEEAYRSVLAHCRAQGENIIRVDARGTIDEVHQKVVGLVQDTIKSNN